MARQSFDAQLKNLNTTWKKSQETQAQMFTDVEDGTYEADLVKAKIEKTSNNNMRIARQHVIVGGDSDGCAINDGMNLESDVGMSFTREWLNKCGYEAPENLVDLPSILDNMVKDNIQCKITVSHSGDYVNVRVHEVLSEGGTGGGSGEGGGEADDYTIAEIEGMTRDELVSTIEDEELDIAYETRKFKKDEVLIDAVIEALELTEEPAPIDPGDGDAIGAYTYNAIQEMDKQNLRTIIKKEGLKLKSADHRKVADLRNAVCDKLNLSAEEEDGEADGDDGAILDELAAFCSAHDVTIPEDIAKEEDIDSVDDVDDIDLMIKIIGGWTYTEDELTEDETALLKEFDLDDRIEVAKKEKERSSGRANKGGRNSSRRNKK